MAAKLAAGKAAVMVKMIEGEEVVAVEFHIAAASIRPTAEVQVAEANI